MQGLGLEYGMQDKKAGRRIGEQEEDREAIRTDEQGDCIVSRHRGGKDLRTVAQQGALVHRDVRRWSARVCH
jgi:hypothetical protein